MPRGAPERGGILRGMQSSRAAPFRADQIAAQRWGAAQLLAFGWSEREVAWALGKSRAWVRKYGRPLVPQVIQRAQADAERAEAGDVPDDGKPQRRRDGRFAPRDHKRPGRVLGVFTA